jgi:hypothetical protein
MWRTGQLAQADLSCFISDDLRPFDKILDGLPDLMGDPATRSLETKPARNAYNKAFFIGPTTSLKHLLDNRLNSAQGYVVNILVIASGNFDATITTRNSYQC